MNVCVCVSLYLLTIVNLMTMHCATHSTRPQAIKSLPWISNELKEETVLNATSQVFDKDFTLSPGMPFGVRQDLGEIDVIEAADVATVGMECDRAPITNTHSP